jgi:hypothetical protein
MSRLRSLLFLAAFLLAPSALAEPFTGKIYDQGSHREKPLYNLARTELRKGEQLIVDGVYATLEGKEAVREQTIMEGGKLRKYIFKQLQTGESGFLEIRGDKVFYSWTKDGETETDEDDLEPNLVIAPTTIDYLARHWDRILKGDEIKVRFAVLERQGTVGFKFFKVGETKVDGKEAVRVKMKPTSFIVAALVDPLIFTLDKATVRLLEIQGRTFPKKLVDGEWKDLDADITYQYASGR